tara:strand:- start:31 stop:225 length:195 start_codon:yes stop_codon:yes gene_type:complete
MDEVLVTVETDKTTAEIRAEEAGVVEEIFFKPGLRSLLALLHLSLFVASHITIDITALLTSVII